jgi:hypothetical protein
MLQDLGDLCCSALESTVLDWAMLVKLTDSAASKMAPANASPNDRPNDPPAEFTPAASLAAGSARAGVPGLGEEPGVRWN